MVGVIWANAKQYSSIIKKPLVSLLTFTFFFVPRISVEYLFILLINWSLSHFPSSLSFSVSVGWYDRSSVVHPVFGVDPVHS